MKADWLDLSRYDRIGVDTETNGNEHTSIPVGCSIWTPDGQGRYYRWGHEKGGNNCSLAEFIRWARVELNHPHTEYIFFNPLFDVRMLWNVGVNMWGGIWKGADTACALLNEYEPAYTLDALSTKYLPPEDRKDDSELNARCAELFGGAPTRRAQAKNYWRAPGDWVEPYAISDGRSTFRLLEIKEPMVYAQDLGDVWRLESMLLPVLHRMYRQGVKINVKEAKRVQQDLDLRYHQDKKEWDRISGGFSFTERTKMVQLLDRLGIEYPRHEPTAKMLAKDPNCIGNPKIDKYFLEDLAKYNPLGALIMRMRQAVHYRDTFIQGYLLDNLQPGDFIFPQFHPTQNFFGGTITGRFSSAGGLNAQNIPARDEEWAPLIRGMFIPATEEHDWLKLDYSQIEYRFFAHYAGGQMRQAYIDNPLQDFHQFVMDLTNLKRKPAKNVNFAKLYGAGIKKMALTIGCSEEEAERIVKIYDQKIPEAKKLISRAMNKASVRGYITTWGGRVLRFQRRGRGYEKTFTALNKLLQGSSADLTKHAMVAVDQHIDWDETRMHLTVHDELDFSVPKGSAGIKMARQLKEIMQDFELTVPIIAEAEIGPDWGHCDALPEAA